MPSEFRETAEDLNTTESVQVDGNAIRRRVDAFTGSDHYRFTIDGIEYDAHWAHDTRRLLDENARLNAALDEVHELWGAAEQDRERAERERDEVRSEASRLYRSLQQTAKRVEDDRDALAATVEALSARLTAKIEAMRVERDRAINECDDWETKYAELSVERDALRRSLPAAPEMPRPPAEGLAAKLDELQSELDALKARRDAPPETSREYLQRMGAEFRSNMARLKARDEAEAERDRLAAQEPVSGPETAGTGSGRGTGVTEAQASDG